MRLVGSSKLSADLAIRLNEVSGLASVEVNESSSDFSFEAVAQIEARGSYSHGPGFASERYLANPEVETDVLRALDQQGYDASISRPIEVRNDGSFAVSAKKRSGPAL